MIAYMGKHVQQKKKDEFAMLLKNWREGLGLSQSQAASELKVKIATLQNWEIARTMPQGLARTALLNVISNQNQVADKSLINGVDSSKDNCSPVSKIPMELNKIYLQDCIAGMKSLPDHSIDIAIADPPYNLSKGGDWKWDNSVKLPGFGGNWSKVMENWDSMPLADYLNFTFAWVNELRRVVKPTGSIWIHGTYHNIGIINFILQSLETEIINEVIWYKRNSFPNLAGRRLTASHEAIIWAHTGKKRQYYFNYEASKKMECRGDALKNPGKQMRTVWDIPNNKEREELRHGKHPTQKPVRLLMRMLELSAKPGWTCLIPFAGSGSECVAAKRFGMKFLAFETDQNYLDICQRRVDAETTPLFKI